MKERPILFSAPTVRAILAGQKTQTRRVFKLPPRHRWDLSAGGEIKGNIERDSWYPGPWHVSEFRCPYGQPGDRLWVREAFAVQPDLWAKWRWPQPVHYLADTPRDQIEDYVGKPSIHMPRWASRITLEITGVRVERLQDISADDCKAEGCMVSGSKYESRDGQERAWCEAIRWVYRDLWESINGPGSWDANPHVWVIEFKKLGQE